MLQSDLMFWQELSHMSKIPIGYGLNDCPPIKETVPLSIQQIVVLVFNVLPVPLLIGAGIGLSASEITILVAGCLLVTGIATLLQTIGVGPIGARLPIPLECSFVFVAPGIALGAQYGLAAFTGACLVGSIITTILWTGLHKQLSILFKPYITGAVVMALGLSLCSVGIGYCEMEMIQLAGVDSTLRETDASLDARAKIVITERLLTHGRQKARSNMTVNLNGRDSSAQIVSRSVAKDSSEQVFYPRAVGNTACRADSP